MGINLKDRASISGLIGNCATDFIGEVFFDELRAVLGDTAQDHFVVSCQGMNQRVRSNDVLSTDSLSVTVNSEIKEFLQLNLARNSIYHELPELLFHPIVLSSPGMSNKEIVEAIKANEKQDKELIQFFSPFDTFFFLENHKMLNRHLNLFSDPEALSNLRRVIDSILDCKTDFTIHERFKLFTVLLNTESYKENLPLLENLLYDVLGLHVRLSYEDAEISSFAYEGIGTGVLGYDIGINGIINSEIDDVKADIRLAGEEIDCASVERLKQKVRCILEYFVLSSRSIKISYSILSNFDFELGSKRLGYDTNL